MADEFCPGIFRHYKGKNYQLLSIAKHSETLEEMVVYRALYGEENVWVRPAAMWNETVEFDDQIIRRFTYVGDKSSSQVAL